ncbi:MAG TPA: DUF6265 family protein [Rhodanobacteraceae bacterium]|nr:DUF6265 family protein [Rhodanobacteraceae bacterium]
MNSVRDTFTVMIVAVALTALVARAAGAAEPDIEKLAWLAGCWASDDAEPGSGERWLLAGEVLVGISRTIRQGETVASEHMEIGHLADGKLAFVAHPSGQATATFVLLRIGAAEVVFENLEHDFPQRIVYARDGESKLRARIEGKQGGALRVIEFPMTRTNCDSEAAP